MSPADYIRELTYPLRSIAMALAIFAVVVVIGAMLTLIYVNPWIGALISALVAAMTVPGLMRYLTHIVDRRAMGYEAEAPEAEHFALLGSFWQVWPFLVFLGWALLATWLAGRFGSVWALASAFLFAALYPAVVAVLVITHSPIQSMNPQALLRLVVRTGDSYWYAPLTALAVVVVPALLRESMPFLALVAFVYLVFAFYAVTGAMLQAENLIEEVDIPAPVEPDRKRQLRDLEQQRTAVLNHAYGFASRGNRENGLAHIAEWIREDPDPYDAWAWFFDKMLKWENTQPALFFAQRYLSYLLEGHDHRRAVKVLLRCRYENPGFRPLAEDLDAAIAAAQDCGNAELATDLKRL